MGKACFIEGYIDAKMRKKKKEPRKKNIREIGKIYGDS